MLDLYGNSKSKILRIQQWIGGVQVGVGILHSKLIGAFKIDSGIKINSEL